MPPGVYLRGDGGPDDVAAIVRLHGELYAAEYGFDETFAAYVETPLTAFAAAVGARERLWVAERAGALAGSVAIVEASRVEAQLRWFLVAPAARGRGLGTRLLAEAVSFSRDQGYASLFLWTVDVLAPAARLYRAAGFERVETHPRTLWGVDLVEERYALPLV